MTSERLRELVAAGETLDIEFKGEEQRPFSDRDLVEAVVCLANRPGDAPGWLLVGVEDDGRVTGARPRHEAGNTDLRRVQALIANRTRPSLSCRVVLIDLDGRLVLAVEVPPSRGPLGTADGMYLRRGMDGRGRPACLPFHFHEMQARAADRGMLDYSALLVPEASWEDLDLLEFERYRRSIRESRGQGDRSLLQLSDVELAKALGAVEANHHVTGIRVLGLLLFGREDALRHLIPTHEVAFQVLSGTQVRINDFFRWPLIRLMDEMMSRFRARNEEEEILVGPIRVGVPDYAEPAVREGLANALIHQDYTRLGAVHFQWRDEAIEVSSPGGFPEGVRLDNLLVTPPMPRNPLLADAFKRAGIVERTARGIDTIFEEQLRNGRRAPSYERSTQTSVVLILPGGKADLSFVRLLVEESQAGRPLALDDLLVLNSLQGQRRVTVTETALLIQKPDAEARTVLERLVESGILEGRGEGVGRSFHLSAATYRRLGDKAAYVRQRGFEPLQQEQMVLQYVRAHGRITRGETADLCHLSSEEARRLLGRLTRRSLLCRLGEKRGTFYEEAPKVMDDAQRVMGGAQNSPQTPKSGAEKNLPGE